MMTENLVNATLTMATEGTQRARGAQPGNKNGQKHGDNRRKRQQRERGIDAIDGRTSEGKRANTWLDYVLKKKTGESKPRHGNLKRWRRKVLRHVLPDTREKIVAGTFYLWRAGYLQAYIIDDANERGTLINRRRGTLPTINAQYDTAMEQWQRINNELQLDKRVDLARHLMEQARANGGEGR